MRVHGRAMHLGYPLTRVPTLWMGTKSWTAVTNGASGQPSGLAAKEMPFDSPRRPPAPNTYVTTPSSFALQRLPDVSTATTPAWSAAETWPIVWLSNLTVGT